MARPKCKIETYTAAVLDHTITDGFVTLSYKDTVTDGVGTFSFTLPMSSTYTDIALHDKVKIYLGYNAVPASPNFMGRITRLSKTLNPKQLTVSGYDMGEVLLRYFKRFKFWDSQHTEDIIQDIADDFTPTLYHAADVDNEEHHLDVYVIEKNYLDLLQEVSDRWLTGPVHINNDFHVETDEHLHWHARPWRTCPETFLEGKNIRNYDLVTDVNKVKNKIWVYGAFDHDTLLPQMKIPTNETWTETLTNWVFTDCAGVLDGSHDEGTWSVKVTPTANPAYASLVFTPEYACISGVKNTQNNSFSQFTWAMKGAPSGGGALLTAVFVAPTLADQYTYIKANGNWANWETHTVTFNDGTELIDDTTPDDGEPAWDKIVGLYFEIIDFTNIYFDDARLLGGRLFHITEDSGGGSSQDLYGVRELIVEDETLKSVADCTLRGEMLLAQLKDPPVQVSMTVDGNANVLSGDRIPNLTLPTAGLPATDFDVLSAEQSVVFSEQEGWSTTITGMNTAYRRRPLDLTPKDVLISTYRALTRLSGNVVTRGMT
jgi:hypothetical protein